MLLRSLSFQDLKNTITDVAALSYCLLRRRYWPDEMQPEPPTFQQSHLPTVDRPKDAAFTVLRCLSSS